MLGAVITVHDSGEDVVCGVTAGALGFAERVTGLRVVWIAGTIAAGAECDALSVVVAFTRLLRMSSLMQERKML